MSRTIKIAAALGLATLVLLTGTGCSEKGNEVFRDAPKTAQRNEAPATIITFPDGFTNYAGKCDGPNYIYSAYHGDGSYAAGFVVPNDPRCTK